MISRRTLLALAAASALAACSRPADQETDVDTPRTPYGDDPSQFFELTRPSGASRGVVVVIHGGFWQSGYDLSLGRPLAASLVEQGWTACNLEYRRVGNGGGWPGTLDDVAAGVDALAEVDDLDTSVVLTLGHSAGGQLAAYVAARDDAAVPITGVVSQAGVLDLVTAAEQNLGGSAVQSLLGGDPDQVPDRYRRADPLQGVPLDVPVRCIHGRDDQIVPPEQSRTYVEAAKRAGADASLTMVDGDHFTLIDTGSEAWTTTLELLAGLT